MAFWRYEKVDWSTYEGHWWEFFKDALKVSSGRLGRSGFLLLVMISSVLRTSTQHEILPHIPEYLYAPVVWSVLIISLYVGLCAHAKRFRDFGLSGWWSVPVVSLRELLKICLLQQIMSEAVENVPWLMGGLILLLLPFFLIPGQKGDNKYGSTAPVLCPAPTLKRKAA